MSTFLPETRTACYAWVLMSDHAHFLFRSRPAGIATRMRRLLTGYAIGFNRRQKPHGQLFQNRYKSIVCRQDTYLKELVRSIGEPHGWIKKMAKMHKIVVSVESIA